MRKKRLPPQPTDAANPFGSKRRMKYAVTGILAFYSGGLLLPFISPLLGSTLGFERDLMVGLIVATVGASFFWLRWRKIS
ncbi:MAG TPA: hypothetical protein VK737_05050 [Opitutales bacterium]|nr:hypothetical protein [Opitutales bacterium]